MNFRRVNDMRWRDNDMDMMSSRRPLLAPIVRVTVAFVMVFASAAVIYMLLGFSIPVTVTLLLMGAATILILALSVPAMIISHYNAREITAAQIPRMERILHELSNQFQVPTPRMIIVPSREPNAFAFGFGRRVRVGVTEGLLAILDDDELRAVVAHEFAHIRNRDTSTLTLGIAVKKTLIALGVLLVILIVIAGMIVVAVLLSLARSKSKRAARGLMIVPIIVALGVYILSPFIISIGYFFFSRKAELRADACSARVTGRPGDLARALVRVHRYHSPGLATEKYGVYSSLWIASKEEKGLLDRLLSSHPSVEERVRRLMEIEGYDRGGIAVRNLGQEPGPRRDCGNAKRASVTCGGTDRLARATGKMTERYDDDVSRGSAPVYGGEKCEPKSVARPDIPVIEDTRGLPKIVDGIVTYEPVPEEGYGKR